MGYSNNSIVTLQLERVGIGFYSFTSADKISDGDHLWDRNANVVYDIQWHSTYGTNHTSNLFAHADPDPLFQSSTLQLEVL